MASVRFRLVDIKATKVYDINQVKEFEVDDTPKRFKQGHCVYSDGRRLYMKSSWEANVAAYLDFLKANNQILEWEYEVFTFWFLKILRGVRSYKPDFRVTRLDGSKFYIEVKGWMDPKSATKLKRMKIYHPDVEIQLIEKKQYFAIAKGKRVYKGWGQLQ